MLTFSVATLLNVAGILLLSFAISLFTGKIAEVFTVLFSFALLRQVSGGLHLKTSEWCIVISATGANLITLVQLGPNIVMYLNLAAVILVALFAPTDLSKQSRIPAKYYPHLKLIAILFVSVNFILQNPMIACAFFVQGLTLIRKEVKFNAEKIS